MRIYQFTIYTQLSKYINTLSLKVEWLRGYRRGNEIGKCGFGSR